MKVTPLASLTEEARDNVRGSIDDLVLMLRWMLKPVIGELLLQ
jgi:hypothetical protein